MSHVFLFKPTQLFVYMERGTLNWVGLEQFCLGVFDGLCCFSYAYLYFCSSKGLVILRCLILESFLKRRTRLKGEIMFYENDLLCVSCCSMAVVTVWWDCCDVYLACFSIPTDRPVVPHSKWSGLLSPPIDMALICSRPGRALWPDRSVKSAHCATRAGWTRVRVRAWGGVPVL